MTMIPPIGPGGRLALWSIERVRPYLGNRFRSPSRKRTAALENRFPLEEMSTALRCIRYIAPSNGIDNLSCFLIGRAARVDRQQFLSARRPRSYCPGAGTT